MTKKKKYTSDIEKVSEEFTLVQEEINKDLLNNNNKQKEKNKTYVLFVSLFRNLRENKLYFLSFVITVFSIFLFSIIKVQEAEGIYNKHNLEVDKSNVPVSKEENNTNVVVDEIDVSDYIGIYSKEFVLTTPITVSETCKVDSYKLVYQVKKDKTITKYLYNSCIGTIQIWSDKVGYISSGGARYISANKVNYLFSPTSMKEVDGETYSTDNTISSLKNNKKVKNVDFYFYGDNIVIRTDTNLLHLKGSNINYNLQDKFTNNGGNLKKIVYKAGASNQFNFIIFSNGDDNTCYSNYDASTEDSLVYKIYSIKYDSENNSFNTEKELVARYKSDKCENYETDLKILDE